MNAKSRLLLITLATLLGIAVTASLGRWQLNRAAEKLALQASIDRQSQQQPVDAAALADPARSADLIHRHARLKGRWVADQTVYLDNRQMNAKVGFFVVTPLLLEGEKQAVIVQRGWVPRNFVERDRLPGIETPAGWVTVEGRIAPPPSKLFEPGAASNTVIRQNLDLEQYQMQTRLPLLPVMLMQTGAASEGLLREWPAPNLGVEKHYGYALQWFGLAALQLILYGWFQLIKPLYLRSKDSTPHA